MPVDMTKEVNVKIINPRMGGYCQLQFNMADIIKKAKSHKEYITELQADIEVIGAWPVEWEEARHKMKILEAELKHNKALEDFNKVKCLIYDSIAKEKSIENLIPHLKNKLKSSLGETLEYLEELVTLGFTQEDEYLSIANQSKDAYENFESLIDYYNTSEDIIITNTEVVVEQ